MQESDLRQLLSQLSLDEKIGQLVQIPGTYYQSGSVLTGNLSDSTYTAAQLKLAGSTLGIWGADTIRSIQKQYMQRHPHHIPMLFMLDVVHGMRTIFPAPLAQAASFHPELVCQGASIAAQEASACGIHVSFAPMADLARDARWGRVMESYGEDPYLNGIMTEAAVDGFQSTPSFVSCIKHFAAYGAPTAGRDYQNVELSEHSLREFYLPAYSKGIKAGAGMVMASFNTIEGIPATGNRWLLRDILRKEMGFEGVLISDWGAIHEMVAHGFCEDDRTAAKYAMKAGIDIDMASNAYGNHLKDLIESGEIEELLLDQAVYRVLSLKNRLGLFEQPYPVSDSHTQAHILLKKEHRQTARVVAEESFVLLKNKDSILPLRKSSKTVLTGPYVNAPDMHSSWAITGDRRDSVTVLNAAENACTEGFSFLPVPVGPVLRDLSGLHRPGKDELSQDIEALSDPDSLKAMEKEVLSAVREAENVVLFLGEHRLQSGEAASRTDIRLPEWQIEFLRSVHEQNSRIVSVIFTGRPLDLREVSELSKAVLIAWLPGTEGGPALMNLLTGKCSPSGKLPMSMPYHVGQVPIFYSQYATGRPVTGPNDDTFYRSRYLDCPNDPLYPFGYGLSYTTFQISDVQLSASTLTCDRTITAAVTVTNTGQTKGSEVIQLYIQDVTASVVRPLRELKGFTRLSLTPGESRQIHFSITEEMLRFHSPSGAFISEKGLFRLWISNSSIGGDPVEFQLL